MNSTFGFHPSSGLLPDIAETLCDADAPDCVFGDPPGPLLPLHRRRFVNDFWERMVDAMLQPVAEDRRFGIRRVQILGQRIFEFAPDGRIDVQDWAEPPHWLGSRRRVPPAYVRLDEVPEGERWINIFADGFRFELSCRLQAEPLALDNYTDWVFDEARARIRYTFDVDSMRRKIRSALQLDEAVLDRITRAGSTRALLSDYNEQKRRR